jgi:prolipoprotein diacylglyceryltransferase
VHPTAGGYELIGDLVILALLLFVARRWVRVPGWSFCFYVISYGVMRFFLSEFRIDEQTAWDIPMPQITSAVVVAIAVMAAGLLLRHPGPITREWRERMFPAGHPPAQAASSAGAG